MCTRVGVLVILTRMMVMVAVYSVMILVSVLGVVIGRRDLLTDQIKMCNWGNCPGGLTVYAWGRLKRDCARRNGLRCMPQGWRKLYGGKQK